MIHIYHFMQLWHSKEDLCNSQPGAVLNLYLPTYCFDLTTSEMGTVVIPTLEIREKAEGGLGTCTS